MSLGTAAGADVCAIRGMFYKGRIILIWVDLAALCAVGK